MDMWLVKHIACVQFLQFYLICCDNERPRFLLGHKKAFWVELRFIHKSWFVVKQLKPRLSSWSSKFSTVRLSFCSQNIHIFLSYQFSEVVADRSWSHVVRVAVGLAENNLSPRDLYLLSKQPLDQSFRSIWCRHSSLDDLIVSNSN